MRAEFSHATAITTSHYLTCPLKFVSAFTVSDVMHIQCKLYNVTLCAWAMMKRASVGAMAHKYFKVLVGCVYTLYTVSDVMHIFTYSSESFFLEFYYCSCSRRPWWLEPLIMESIPLDPVVNAAFRSQTLPPLSGRDTGDLLFQPSIGRCSPTSGSLERISIP